MHSRTTSAAPSFSPSKPMFPSSSTLPLYAGNRPQVKEPAATGRRELDGPGPWTTRGVRARGGAAPRAYWSGFRDTVHQSSTRRRVGELRPRGGGGRVVSFPGYTHAQVARDVIRVAPETDDQAPAPGASAVDE